MSIVADRHLDSVTFIISVNHVLRTVKFRIAGKLDVRISFTMFIVEHHKVGEVSAADAEYAACADKTVYGSSGKIVCIMCPEKEIHVDRDAQAEYTRCVFTDDPDVGEIEGLNIFSVLVFSTLSASR